MMIIILKTGMKWKILKSAYYGLDLPLVPTFLFVQKYDARHVIYLQSNFERPH